MTHKYLILDKYSIQNLKKNWGQQNLQLAVLFSIFIIFDYTTYLKNNFEFITKIKAFFIKIWYNSKRYKFRKRKD